MESKEHAKFSKEAQFPKDDFLQESKVTFREVSGIVDMIQEDMTS